MSKLSNSFSSACFELKKTENDTLQRLLNSSFVDYSTLPSLQPSESRAKRFRSLGTSPKGAKRPWNKKPPLSKDISFLEPDNFSQSFTESHAGEKRTTLIKAQAIDQIRLEEFCRSMLNPAATAAFTLLPNQDFGRPTNRRDAELLTQWVEQREAEILQIDNASDLFEQAQLMYGQCLRELTRQVAVHCSERGALLDKVMRAYFFLFEKVLLAYKKDIARRDAANRAKVTKLHEVYLSKLDQLRKKGFEQSERIHKLEEDLESNEFKIQSFASKEKNYQERIKIIQLHYEETKRKLQAIENLPEHQKAQDQPGSVFALLTRPPQVKKADPFLDKELAGDIDELANQKNHSLSYAGKLFKRQVQKLMLFNQGSESELKVFATKSTQTKLNKFPIPPVQAESSQSFQDRAVRKRISQVWKPQTLLESHMVLERLSESLKDIDLILLGNDMETLPAEAQQKHSNLRMILEQCVDFTNSGIQHRDYLSSQIKKMQMDLLEKEKHAKLAERKYRDLDEEHIRLTDICERLELEVSRLNRELKERPNDEHSPVVKTRGLVESEGIRRPQRAFTAFKEFRLGQKKILYKRSSNLPSTVLVDKFTSDTVKPKATMTVKTLLKLLMGVMADYKQQSKDNQLVRSQEFAHYTYDWLMTKHGLRRVTEQKFLHLLAASQFFKENKRVQLFGRFLQLYEPLTCEDLKFYVQLTDVMTKWGLAPETLEVEDSLLDHEVCNSVLSEVLLPKFPDLDQSKLKFELEVLGNRSGFLPQYDFVSFAVKKYRGLLSVNKNFVVDLFKAADLNGDGFLELEEFEVLCRHIVKDAKRVAGIGRIFESSADLMLKFEENDEPKPVISLEKFSALSIEFDLFGIDAQNEFMEVQTDADIIDNFTNLKLNREKVCGIMRLWIRQIPIDHSTLLQSLALLESKLSGDGNERSLFMAFKLLQAESKMQYTEYYLERFQPRLCRCAKEIAQEFLDSED